MYQIGYQMYDLKEIISKSAGLWGSYGLKQGNIISVFQNTNQIVFILFINLYFDLLYQRGYQRQYV